MYGPNIVWPPGWHQLNGPALLTYWGDDWRSLNITDRNEIVLGRLNWQSQELCCHLRPRPSRRVEIVRVFAEDSMEESQPIVCGTIYRPVVSSFCFGTARATDFKFCAQLATKSTNLQMTNCPLSGRGHGYVTHSRISHPWNISRTAEVRVVKFYMLPGYIKC